MDYKTILLPTIPAPIQPSMSPDYWSKFEMEQHVVFEHYTLQWILSPRKPNYKDLPIKFQTDSSKSSENTEHWSSSNYNNIDNWPG